MCMFSNESSCEHITVLKITDMYAIPTIEKLMYFTPYTYGTYHLFIVYS